MNSTAPAGDRSRSQPGPRSRALAVPVPECAICTPVPPPLIRIPFPAISFDCGGACYRTRPVELVAVPCGEGSVEGGEGKVEDGEWRMEDGTGHGAASSQPATQSAPSAIFHPPSSPCAPALPSPHAPPPSAYSLRKGLGAWQLVFEGRQAQLRHERGLLYVAWLLYHPPAQPLHALDLAAQIPELYRAQLGLGALTDPATGQAAALASHARLQERSLALDDAQSLRFLRRHEQELEAILDDDAASEPVKAEARRELEAIAAFQRQHGRPSPDAAQRAVRAVRQAIKRLHTNLAAAVDTHGAPHPVLHPFAEHLWRYLLIPSGRYAAHGNRLARNGVAGCFTYTPPEGVVWGK